MKPTIKHAYYTARFSGHGPVTSTWLSVRWYWNERMRMRRLRAILYEWF